MAKISEFDQSLIRLEEAAVGSLELGNETSTVLAADLKALLDWQLKVRTKNPFLIGDRVKLPVTGDPEDGPEPETGEVIGLAGGGGLLIRPETGEYSDTKTGLWYEGSTVERLED